jgi:hypothetical protein
MTSRTTAGSRGRGSARQGAAVPRETKTAARVPDSSRWSLVVSCQFDSLAGQPQFQLARAAADRRAVEANVAATTAFAALLQAVAERLDLLAAFLVAARAGDAAAVLGVLALAVGEGEAALAAANAILAAVAANATFREHPAEILERAARDVIVALALDLAAVFGLLELDLASRHDVPVGE